MAGENRLGTIEAARRVGIELHRLYSWEQSGIVKPRLQRFGSRKFRRYSQNDIDKARFIKLLVDREGYTLRAAIRKLNHNNINENVVNKTAVHSIYPKLKNV